MKLRHIIYLSAGLLFVLWISYSKSKKNSAKKHAVILNGILLNRVSHVLRTYRVYNCDFEFVLHDTKYSVISRTGLDFDMEKNYLVGKCFPIIYDSTNPENAYMLISRENFESFNVEFPDSLRWIYQAGNY